MQFDPTSDWVSEASIAPTEVMLKNKDPFIPCTYLFKNMYNFLGVNMEYMFNFCLQSIYHVDGQLNSFYKAG